MFQTSFSVRVFLWGCVLRSPQRTVSVIFQQSIELLTKDPGWTRTPSPEDAKLKPTMDPGGPGLRANLSLLPYLDLSNEHFYWHQVLDICHLPPTTWAQIRPTGAELISVMKGG